MEFSYSGAGDDLFGADQRVMMIDCVAAGRIRLSDSNAAESLDIAFPVPTDLGPPAASLEPGRLVVVSNRSNEGLWIVLSDADTGGLLFAGGNAQNADARITTTFERGELGYCPARDSGGEPRPKTTVIVHADDGDVVLRGGEWEEAVVNGDRLAAVALMAELNLCTESEQCDFDRLVASMYLLATD